MNKIKLLISLFTIIFASSCSDYLEVTLQDQMTIKEVFSKRITTEQYLAQVYGFLPREYDYIKDAAGSAVPRSDEAMFSWYQWVDYLAFNEGSWGPTTKSYNIWKNKYTGINQATIFMEHVNECVEISQQTRTEMKAEARFLRAYFYFELFRQYGPVFIWGDRMPDPTIKAESIDRNTVDENIDFMVKEYDKAITDLPDKISDKNWLGRITKGAAMAAKSRLLLYAASPLYNGCELYRGQMKNKAGNFLFPQEAKSEKWEAAAVAAKAVIDLGIYRLYKDTEEKDDFRRAIKSYQGVMFDQWNDEIILGAWARFTAADGNSSAFYYHSRCLPPNVMKQAYGGFCPSLKLVDTYPMASSGRYPVTGYNSNGTPIIDPKSGYREDGFTDAYTHPLDNFGKIKAHNNCVGRDARFYASVVANGFYWINDLSGKKLVTFYTGGTSSYTPSGDCVKVGYLWRRMTDPTLNTDAGKWGKLCWPYYRLAEIYLNYAEACNEKDQRNEGEALKYINEVRNRSGLNKLEEAYPEVVGNQTLLRTLIQKERMVELAFEGHRLYDLRRWMTAEKELNGPNYTLNLLSTTYESSWIRTSQVWGGGDRVFLPKHYFFPINQDQLSEMKNITQNYGW
ncbi:MAG: RagB/SusD family nutrient uptake outer membrane protein [Muribaculaceae bacterium]